jgi:hypothetical protein
MPTVRGFALRARIGDISRVKPALALAATFVSLVVVTQPLRAAEGPAAAHADHSSEHNSERSVALLPLTGVDVDATLVQRTDATLRTAIDRLLDALQVKEDSAAAATSLACMTSDVACVVRIGAKAGVQEVVIATVSQRELVARVIDVKAGRETNHVSVPAPIDDAAARAAMTQLLAPERYVGALAVSVTQRGAVVFVDGEAKGTTPLLAPIAGLGPRRHHLEVRYPNTVPYQGFVDIAFDRVVTVELTIKNSELVDLRGEATPGAWHTGLLASGLATTGVGLAAGGLSLALALEARAVHDQIERTHDVTQIGGLHALLTGATTGAIVGGAGVGIGAALLLAAAWVQE